MEKLKLKDLFPPHTYEQWREVVEKQLKGAPFEKKLVTKSYEGIDIQPMYFQHDIENLPHLDAYPGGEPYVRGSRLLGHVVDSWTVAQEIGYSDPAEFNRAARLDISRGQTGLNMIFDKASQKGLNPYEADAKDVGKNGVSFATLDDAMQAFAGIDIPDLPFRFQTGANGLALTALILGYLNRQGGDITALKGSIALDPLAVLAVEGNLPCSLAHAYDEMAELTAWAVNNAPDIRTIAVHSHPYHEGGGSAVEELAFVMATGIEYLREMIKRGRTANDVGRKITFSFSIGSDFFMEIAKIRAARLVWEKIIDVFGGDAEAKKMNVHIRTSRWNKTQVDPYVNMLRATTETFSGICSGCDSMHVGPFDEVFRTPDDFSRRIARNVQIVLREECHFDKVIDPTGGSYYVEKITDEIARKSWALMQDVEKQGGMIKALEAGFPQKTVAQTADKRQKDYASRKNVFVGVNKYPNVTEKPLAVDQMDFTTFQKSRGEQVKRFIESNTSDELKALLKKVAVDADNITGQVVKDAIQAAAKGATLGEITAALRSGAEKDKTPATIDPVRIHRGAEAFEALRRATRDFAEKTGETPKIFLANIGPLAQHKPRTDFSYGFFNVAGFDVLGEQSFPTPEDACDAALKSGAKVVAICSTDDVYPDVVPKIAQQLKAADPQIMIILAGYPKDHVEAFKQAGVDDFIHLRSNALEQLQHIQKRLGVV